MKQDQPTRVNDMLTKQLEQIDKAFLERCLDAIEVGQRYGAGKWEVLTADLRERISRYELANRPCTDERMCVPCFTGKGQCEYPEP